MTDYKDLLFTNSNTNNWKLKTPEEAVHRFENYLSTLIKSVCRLQEHEVFSIEKVAISQVHYFNDGISEKVTQVDLIISLSTYFNNKDSGSLLFKINNIFVGLGKFSFLYGDLVCKIHEVKWVGSLIYKNKRSKKIKIF